MTVTVTHSRVKCQQWAGRRVNGREGGINIYESHFLLHEEQFSILLRLAIRAMTLLSEVGEGPKIFSWPTLFMKSLLLKSLTHHEYICNSNSQTRTEQHQGELPEPHGPRWSWTNSTQCSHSRPSKQCSASSLSDATLFFRIFVLCVVTLLSKCSQTFCWSAVYRS